MPPHVAHRGHYVGHEKQCQLFVLCGIGCGAGFLRFSRYRRSNEVHVHVYEPGHEITICAVNPLAANGNLDRMRRSERDDFAILYNHCLVRKDDLTVHGHYVDIYKCGWWFMLCRNEPGRAGEE